MSALRDSFKINHAADVVMLLQSKRVEVQKKNGPSEYRDQFQLYKERFRAFPDKMVQIDEAEANFPLHEDLHSTYARISILKNRFGRQGDVLFVYHKAIHTFEPVSINFSTESED